MTHVYTVIVIMASIVASAPTYASDGNIEKMVELADSIVEMKSSEDMKPSTIPVDKLSNEYINNLMARIEILKTKKRMGQLRRRSRGRGSSQYNSKGSCLSYGHSCWGAHGKRSSDQAKWFVSKLAPIPMRAQRNQQARLAQLFLSQKPTDEDNNVDNDLIIADDESYGRETSPDERQERQLVLMEQPPRIFQFLKQLPRQADLENSRN